SPLVEQFQPTPPAFAIELNASAGNGSITVTVPSVGPLPVFETDSVNVVGCPATRPPECVFARLSCGADTVLTVCGDVSSNTVPSVAPVKFATAALRICCPGAASALIVTSNVNATVAPGAIRPPVVALPPAPSRTTTFPVAELNSAASSLSASVG